MTEAAADTQESAYVKVSDVATELNMSVRSIYDLIAARELKSSRFGTGRLGLRVHRDSLDAFKKRREENP